MTSDEEKAEAARRKRDAYFAELAEEEKRGAKKKPRQAPNGTQPPPRSPYMMGLDAAAHGSRRID